jgi:hypothetical protein
MAGRVRSGFAAARRRARDIRARNAHPFEIPAQTGSGKRPAALEKRRAFLYKRSMIPQLREPF